MDGVTAPLVLVAHGSRDDAAHACTGDIVDAVRAALPGVDVRLGYVDVRGPKVVDAVAGLDGAVVVPAFLASGYHVRTDLPAQLAACGVTPDRFRVTPAVGPTRCWPVPHGRGWRRRAGPTATRWCSPRRAPRTRRRSRRCGPQGGCSRRRSDARCGSGSSRRPHPAWTRSSPGCARPVNGGSRSPRGCSRRGCSTPVWRTQGRTSWPHRWAPTRTSSPRSSPATAPPSTAAV